MDPFGRIIYVRLNKNLSSNSQNYYNHPRALVPGAAKFECPLFINTEIRSSSQHQCARALRRGTGISPVISLAGKPSASWESTASIPLGICSISG